MDKVKYFMYELMQYTLGAVVLWLIMIIPTILITWAVRWAWYF